MNSSGVAYLLFVVNFLFGVLVATGIVERGRWSRLHHILYLFAMIGILTALVDAALRSQPIILLVAMALLLLGMTRFRGGSRAHSLYATLCLIAYSALLYKITYGI